MPDGPKGARLCRAHLKIIDSPTSHTPPQSSYSHLTLPGLRPSAPPAWTLKPSFGTGSGADRTPEVSVLTRSPFNRRRASEVLPRFVVSPPLSIYVRDEVVEPWGRDQAKEGTPLGHPGGCWSSCRTLPSGSWKVLTQPPQCSFSGGRRNSTPLERRVR